MKGIGKKDGVTAAVVAMALMLAGATALNGWLWLRASDHADAAVRARALAVELARERGEAARLSDELTAYQRRRDACEEPMRRWENPWQ